MAESTGHNPPTERPSGIKGLFGRVFKRSSGVPKQVEPKLSIEPKRPFIVPEGSGLERLLTDIRERGKVGNMLGNGKETEQSVRYVLGDLWNKAGNPDLAEGVARERILKIREGILDGNKEVLRDLASSLEQEMEVNPKSKEISSLEALKLGLYRVARQLMNNLILEETNRRMRGEESAKLTGMVERQLKDLGVD